MKCLRIMVDSWMPIHNMDEFKGAGVPEEVVFEQFRLEIEKDFEKEFGAGFKARGGEVVITVEIF